MHPRVLLDLSTALLERVLRFDQPADAVVAAFCREHKGLGPRERALLGDAAYRVLRQRRLLEHLAHTARGARVRRLAILGFAGPRDLLAPALTPDEAQWLAACDAVDPAGLPEAERHNLPDWLARDLQQQLGDGFWPLVHSLEQPAPLDLRVNLLMSKRAQAQQALSAEGIVAEPTPFAPAGLRLNGKPSLARLDLFRRGVVEVQDEGSQLIASLVEARRGELVVDFCAGAGGKTLALGVAMRNTGRLYAFDTSAHRLEALKPRLARSGLQNVHLLAVAHERDERALRLAGKVDRVLVDAPCSGLGTLRRHPDLKWRQGEAEVAAFAERQQSILEAAARLLKPGGRLVYATCSLLEAENEAVARAFSAAHPDCQVLDAREALLRQGVSRGDELCKSLDGGGAALRLWPHRHATDGFFAVIWQKNGSI